MHFHYLYISTSIFTVTCIPHHLPLSYTAVQQKFSKQKYIKLSFPSISNAPPLASTSLIKLSCDKTSQHPREPDNLVAPFQDSHTHTRIYPNELCPPPAKGRPAALGPINQSIVRARINARVS